MLSHSFYFYVDPAVMKKTQSELVYSDITFYFQSYQNKGQCEITECAFFFNECRTLQVITNKLPVRKRKHTSNLIICSDIYFLVVTVKLKLFS